MTILCSYPLFSIFTAQCLTLPPPAALLRASSLTSQSQGRLQPAQSASLLDVSSVSANRNLRLSFACIVSVNQGLFSPPLVAGFLQIPFFPCVLVCIFPVICKLAQQSLTVSCQEEGGKKPAFIERPPFRVLSSPLRADCSCHGHQTSVMHPLVVSSQPSSHLTSWSRGHDIRATFSSSVLLHLAIECGFLRVLPPPCTSPLPSLPLVPFLFLVSLGRSTLWPPSCPRCPRIMMISPDRKASNPQDATLAVQLQL